MAPEFWRQGSCVQTKPVADPNFLSYARSVRVPGHEVPIVRLGFVAVALLLIPVSAAAQGQPLAGSNPLAELHDQVTRVLAEANLPFTEEQQRAIVLMMEDRRQASEELFGDLLDFSAGPTQGQDEDRLRSAIDWMRGEFLTQLQNFLTPEQTAVWTRFLETQATESDDSGPQVEQQTQYVRINNNAFTAEDDEYERGGGPDTDIIERGGVGAFHGNAELMLKDDALNARNPLAHNKPEYREHQTSFDFGGPVIPRRLTATVFFSHNKAENVDTIHATTPGGLFDLGIVRPVINQDIRTEGVYQLFDGHSLAFDFGVESESQQNQNIGGFTLPERASNSDDTEWSAELETFSTLTQTSLFETRFDIRSSRSETIPLSEAVQINVLDAFRSGGAQDLATATRRDYEFGTLYTRSAEIVTIKAGVEGLYQDNQSFSQENFGGSFTFSNLPAYELGLPLNYRVTRGNPLLEASQFELSAFMQNDIRLSSRATLMAGLRYDWQTNIDQRNNFAPRVGFALAVGQSSVIRGGAGLFHNRVSLGVIEEQRRLDGSRQFELIVDRPSYPDPFQAGTIRNTLPSVQVLDPNLDVPSIAIIQAAYERTFFRTLLFSASYEHNRDRRLRFRNLNAPLPGDTERPDPTRGNILNVESSGRALGNVWRLSYRHRFSIFNISSTYSVSRSWDDVAPNNPSLPMNNYDLGADWGRIPTPVHQFNSSVNTRLPLGVFLTGIVRANSGRAYTITTGRDNNNDTQVNDRPSGVGRFSERGPAFFQTDFNISKAFFFRSARTGGGLSRMNVNIFVNTTNAFNWTNLGNPSGVMTSPNFGISTSAEDPREIEAGIRFQF